MANTDLLELERLQNKYIDDIVNGTGIDRAVYLEYRDNGKEIDDSNAEKLSIYFKVPVSFFLKRPTFIHYGKDNSFGPIYNNYNYYFAKPETSDDINRLTK